VVAVVALAGIPSPHFSLRNCHQRCPFQLVPVAPAEQEQRQTTRMALPEHGDRRRISVILQIHT
jgi:hypothetical protein